jgi:hypothetical protein
MSEYATVDVFRAPSPEAAGAVVEQLRTEVLPATAKLGGFLGATVQLALDGTTVVSNVRWSGEPADRPSADLPGVTRRTITAASLVTLRGPSAEEPVGWTVTALRPVPGLAGAEALGAKLVETGAFKKDIGGFVGARAYVTGDGTLFVNCPQWIDRDAFERYTGDPRVEAGRPETTGQEDLIVGSVVFTA